MDNLSHSLAGWALSRAAGPARPAGTTLALVLSSNLPDLDVVLLLRSEADYLFYHRGLTHSLVGLAVLPPLLAGGLAWAYAGRTRFRWLLLLSFLGVGLHLVWDVVTPWGTMLLYPFALERYALDWLFIIDPVTWAAPLAALAWTRWRPIDGCRAAVTFMVGLLAYGLVAGLLHDRARTAVTDAEAEEGRAVAEVQAFPRLGAPLRWNGYAAAPPAAPEPRIVWREVAGIPPRPGPARRVERGFDDPWVARALATREGQAYLWWARVPVATTLHQPRRVTVSLRDLRYDPTLVPTVERWTPFELRLRFDRRTGDLLDTVW